MLTELPKNTASSNGTFQAFFKCTTNSKRELFWRPRGSPIQIQIVETTYKGLTIMELRQIAAAARHCCWFQGQMARVPISALLDVNLAE